MWYALFIFVILLQRCLAAKVILVSFDGFRHDYIEKAKEKGYNVSAFEQLANQGFRGMKVLSVMPTLTFPSHYSLATGRYVENHGLVGNTFRDPNFGENYTYRNADQQMEPKWFTQNKNEQIWLSVQRNGGKGGVMYWPGSDSRMYGEMEYVNYGLYSDVPSLNFRVDRVMDWITKPDVNFVAMYYNEPDSTGHRYGPNSEEVLKEVEQCNRGLAYLIQRIEDSNDFLEKPNIIVTSDHGMAEVDAENRVVPIYKHLNHDQYMYGVAGSSATLGIWPLPNGKGVDELYAMVKPACETGNCQVYKKADIPEEYRLKNNDRVAPIMVVAKEGWLLQTNGSNNYNPKTTKGTHGYDNALSDMHPFIVAAGPGIRKLGRVDWFYQVDVYALVMLLLKYYLPAVVDSDVMRVATYVKTIPSLDVLKQFDRYAKGLDPLPDASGILGANTFLMVILLLVIQIILRH